MTVDAPEQPFTVLLVDDERDIRELARLFLERAGLIVSEAADGTQALERFRESGPPSVPAVVVLDNRMPGLTGIEVAEQMLSIHPDQVIVLFSAYLDKETEEAANSAGVRLCVSKKDVRRLPEIIRGLMTAA